jgi:hypothetical protein
VVLETAINMPITAVLYILIVGGFRNRGKHVHHRGIIYRLLVVLETAVNMSVTAVLYIPVVGGFENRGEYVHNRGIRYID